MTTIKDRVRIILAGSPIISGVFTREWPLHGWTHENGGVDEISVEGLDGLLADPQDAGWFEGIPLDDTGLSDGDFYVYDQSSGTFTLVNISEVGGGGGVTDHGSLTGLGDSSDHTWAFLHDGTRAATGDFDMDNHAIDDIEYLGFHINGVTLSEGQVGWNSDAGFLAAGMPGGTVELLFGAEMLQRCQNDEGAQIPNGYAVRVNGSTGNSPTIEFATNTDPINAHAIGLATEDISTGQWGYVCTEGFVNGVDTSSYSAGDYVFLGADGTWLAAPPAAPNIITYLGMVIRSHASAGSVYTNPQVVPSLSYLSDVNVRSVAPTNGQVLAWNSAYSYWEAVSQSGGVTLPLYQIGFGTGSGITSDADLTYHDDGLWIGTGTPGHLSGTETLFVEGWSEFDGRVYFDAPIYVQNTSYFYGNGRFNDSVECQFGSASDAHIVYSSEQTNPSLAIGVSASNTLLVTEESLTDTDLGFDSQSHPTVLVTDTGGSDYVGIYNDGTRGVVYSSNGTVVISDPYIRNATSWTGTVFPFAGADADYDDLATTVGADHSLCWYLIQAYSAGGSGGTLDQAYDYGGAGAGRIINATSGAVDIRNDDEGVNLHVLRTTSDTGHNDLIQITNSDSDAKEITFYGSPGETGYGHRIWTTDAALSVGADFDTLTDYAYLSITKPVTSSLATVGLYATDGGDGASLTLNSAGQATIITDNDLSLSSNDDIIIDASDDLHMEADTADIEATTSIDVNAPELDMNDTPTLHDAATASYSSGTITVNWTTGKYAYVELTGNATTVTMTAPTSATNKFTGPYYLEIAASGAARTFTGFSGVDWTEPYNPDSVAQPIPAGEICVVQLCYRGTMGHGGYLGTVHPES